MSQIEIITRSEIIAELKEYIIVNILDGSDIEMDETVPLLEWGIINSLEIVRLTSFIAHTFQVIIPPEELTAEHFVNLLAITDLVVEHQQG